MLSLRLKTIANLLDPNDSALDIGADHGYLGIYAIKEKLVKKIILTDIKKTALDSARKNIVRANLNIPLIQADGIDNLNLEEINTIIISGMGTKNILHILRDREKLKNVQKLILQSNNNLPELRLGITKLGYQLEDEITIFDNGFWYVVCLFKKKENPILSSTTCNYGIIKEDKIPYYTYLLTKNKEILQNLPSSNKTIKQTLAKQIEELSILLKKG